MIERGVYWTVLCMDGKEEGEGKGRDRGGEVL